MQFYSSFFLILCKRLQLSGGAELNLFSDFRLQAKPGLGRYLMSVGNNLKLPHFDLIRCSAKAAKLFILPEAVPMGLAHPAGNSISTSLFLAFISYPSVPRPPLGCPPLLKSGWRSQTENIGRGKLPRLVFSFSISDPGSEVAKDYSHTKGWRCKYNGDWKERTREAT